MTSGVCRLGLMTGVRVCILRYNNLDGLLRSCIRKVICYEDYTKVQSEGLPNASGHVYFCNLFSVVRYLQMLYQRNFSKHCGKQCLTSEMYFCEYFLPFSRIQLHTVLKLETAASTCGMWHSCETKQNT